MTIPENLPAESLAVIWQKRIDELDAQIESLANERAELKRKILALRSPFRIGDVISWSDGKRRGRVLEISHWICGEPKWTVRRIRKDGSLGEECCVRPFNNPKLVQE